MIRIVAYLIYHLFRNSPSALTFVLRELFRLPLQRHRAFAREARALLKLQKLARNFDHLQLHASRVSAACNTTTTFATLMTEPLTTTRSQ